MAEANNTTFWNKVNEATKRFVREHREDDVRVLALSGHKNQDINLQWALEQIQGWQTARRKLPSWTTIDGIVFPPHLSMEQCSSETTALYKCSTIEQFPKTYRGMLVDLTGGFGVDFAFLAQHFERAVYVERQEHLVETAKHNYGLLNSDSHTQAIFINDDAENAIESLPTNVTADCTLFYIDPARRDNKQVRTYAIADCTPNVLELLPRLLQRGNWVLIKLSPMLDWHKAVDDLGDSVAQVHIVSVRNECKELLMLLDATHRGEPTIYCVNDNQTLAFTPSQQQGCTLNVASDVEAANLYEPNASVMKAGCYSLLTQRFPVAALSTDSHLFLSREMITEFPGRCFAITTVTSLNKKGMATALNGISQANVATRNFPLTAQQLRKRLHLADGGDNYIFGTTTASGEHLLFICKKPS